MIPPAGLEQLCTFHNGDVGFTPDHNGNSTNTVNTTIRHGNDLPKWGNDETYTHYITKL